MDDKGEVGGEHKEITGSSEAHKTRPKSFKNVIKEIYAKKYKQLLILPVAIVVIAIILIISQIVTTGDFMKKDVSLKGGVTVTIPDIVDVDVVKLKQALAADFSKYEVDVRELKIGGVQAGIVVSSDMDGTNKEELDAFLDAINKNTIQDIYQTEYSVEVIGSSLGSSFFREVILSMIVAFILMGIVVMIYFSVPIPSLMVISCAFADIITTLAVVNLLGIKVSSAGIAAFLMLIGYSVDTDILLTSKVLKRKPGKSVLEATLGAMGTGLTMAVTTMIAAIIGILFSQSDVIRQIMTILLIGLILDVFNTWITNAALLRMYEERKVKKHEH